MIPFYPSRSDNQVVTPRAVSGSVLVNADVSSIRFVNSGTKICYVKLGHGPQVATTADIPVMAGESIVLGKDYTEDTCAFISASDTTLNIQTGIGGVFDYTTDPGDVGTIDLVNVTTLMNAVPAVSIVPSYLLGLFGNVLKRISHTDYRALLKTYFDTLYTSAIANTLDGIADTATWKKTSVAAADMVNSRMQSALWDYAKVVTLNPDTLTEMVESASAGAATVKYDDLGFPSMMYVLRGPILAGHLHADMGSVTGIRTATLGAGGSGYTANNLLTVVQSGASGGIYRVLTVDGSGVVLTFQQVAPGTAYAVANGLVTTGGTGTGATINVTAIGPVHNAFMVNGVDKMEILISMFKATSFNGTTYNGSGAGYRAVSWPGLMPTGSLDFDANKALHTAKGTGWHMMSIWERALIMWLSMKMNTEPRGNTYYGRSYESGYEYECAVRSDGLAPGYIGGTAKHRNGSGPSKWVHNGERWGIYDLVGSMSEWTDLIKSVNGLIKMPNDNYFTLAEADWPSQGVYFDNTVAGTGGAPRLNASRVNALIDPNFSTVAHSSLTMTAEYDALDLIVRQRMLKAGISPKIIGAGTNPWSPKGTLYSSNYGERLSTCGGGWSSAADSGIAYLYLVDLRSFASFGRGSRSAFISP